MSRIHDPGSWEQDPGSCIQNPRSRTLEQRILGPEPWIQYHAFRIQDPGNNPPEPGSWVLDPASRILDPESSIHDPRSWIHDPENVILDLGSRIPRIQGPGSRTPDPGSRMQDPGSRILYPAPEVLCLFRIFERLHFIRALQFWFGFVSGFRGLASGRVACWDNLRVRVEHALLCDCVCGGGRGAPFFVCNGSESVSSPNMLHCLFVAILQTRSHDCCQTTAR